MPPDTVKIQEWFAAHIDGGWGSEGVKIKADLDEILAVVTLPTDKSDIPETADDKEVAIKRIAQRFRKETRQSRMSVADSAQELFDRKVSWGVQVGEDTYLFTHVTTPTMTRLRLAEREVLDTLVNAGVASSRSEALGWCVKFVCDNESKWLNSLQEAFKSVEKARNEGPSRKKS
ncbi:MAG: hypothetical protein HQ477_00765 [Chloroflexi bacterium]|nr:hypothetical protein [Chloroflexota bacterium]